MKQKICLSVIALIAILCSVYADSSYLKVVYKVGESTDFDMILIDNGEVQILDNDVNVIFSEAPENNKSYLFENLVSLNYEIVTSTKNPNSDKELTVHYFPNLDNLHLSAKQALGLVKIYSVDGSLVYSTLTDSDNLNINLNTLSHGVYFVSSKNQIVKFLK